MALFIGFSIGNGQLPYGPKIAEELKDIRLQRIINNNLASIFINLKEFEKGKAYANKSLELAYELKNEYAISSSMFNIATAELYLKDYGNALKHYSQIVQIGERTDDYILILDGLLGTADVYNAEHNYNKALSYYDKVISLTKEKMPLNMKCTPIWAYLIYTKTRERMMNPWLPFFWALAWQKSWAQNMN